VPIVPFYKGVVSSVGRVSFLKTPIGSGYHKRLRLVPVGIQKTAQHLFGHFRVCVFVTMGLEICSQCGFLAMAAAENRDMELAARKGFGRFDWGVGEVLLLYFFVCRELVVALK